MAKRFGRNQKRKLIEQLESAREAIEMANGLAEHLGKKNRDLEMIFEDVRKVLGNHFCAFPPDTMVMEVLQPVLKFVPRPSFDVGLYSDTPTPRAISFAVNHLDVMTTSSYMDELRNAVHIRVESGYRDKLGYAMSMAARQSMPKDMLVRRVAEQLAEQIAIEFKKQGL